MILRVLAAGCLALFLGALPVRADAVERLIEALRFADFVGIMQAEGLRHGEGVGRDMLEDAEQARWRRILQAVYDPDVMLETVGRQFSQAVAGTDTVPLLTFFEGQGAAILARELDARRALLEENAEAEADELYRRMDAEGVPLVDQINRMIADSDLIERNVAGALNANLAFYRGLVAGGGFDLSEAEMLADTWAQEDEMRSQTGEWVRAFLVTAYAPVDGAVLEDYVRFWRSAPGRALNRALFAAYDAMYEDLSFRLGRAVAVQMQGEDL